MLYVFYKVLENIFLLPRGVPTDEGLCGGKAGSVSTGSVVAKTEKVEKGTRTRNEERHYARVQGHCSRMMRFQQTRSHRLYK